MDLTISMQWACKVRCQWGRAELVGLHSPPHRAIAAVVLGKVKLHSCRVDPALHVPCFVRYSTRAGFEQLCRLDARFQPFGQTLFSQASLGYVREQQTVEVNAKLDASVLAFCQLLSGYFLLQPSFKALEYLIRRYK